MKYILLILITINLIFCKTKTTTDEQTNIKPDDDGFIYIINKEYKADEIENLSKAELMLIEAEIYGRNGMLKGNKWQQNHIKRKKWFKINKNFNENNFSEVDKKNLNLIRNLYFRMNKLVTDVERPKNLQYKSSNILLELDDNFKIKLLQGTISESDWKILLNREYGEDKRDENIKNALNRVTPNTGFYKVFIDSFNKIRVIENYSGCCGVILSNLLKELYIFNEKGNLLKHERYYVGKKDFFRYYFYFSEKKIKQITIYWDLKKEDINEISIRIISGL